MTVKINVPMAKGEIEISPDADIHDAVDAITGALIAEGYAPGIIKEGYESMARKLKISLTP